MWLLDLQSVKYDQTSDNDGASSKKSSYNAEFSERPMQAFTPVMVSRGCSTLSVVVQENESQATNWDMYDEYMRLRQTEAQVKVEEPKKFRKFPRKIKAKPATEVWDICGKQEWNRMIVSSRTMQCSLELLERLVMHNLYRQQQNVYFSEAVMDTTSTAVPLWEFTCPLTINYQVTSISWNAFNENLLAATYRNEDDGGGLVCCWSVRNPAFPHRWYSTAVAALSVAFSPETPSVLAAGCYDGAIFFYDVTRMHAQPIASSNGTEERHVGPVWQVKWCRRGLLSISDDSLVILWTLKNAHLTAKVVMRLKREPSLLPGSLEAGVSRVARYTAGYCLETTQSDDFYVGDQEGHIHCCSYENGKNDLFWGHVGPVYGIKCSPYLPEVLLSYGGDCTLRIWHRDKKEPLIILTAKEQVVGGCWLPSKAPVFALLHEKGLELWDICQSILSPFFILPASGKVIHTAVVFSPNSKCIVLGNEKGGIRVLELKCVSPAADDHVKVLQSTVASKLNNDKPV